MKGIRISNKNELMDRFALGLRLSMRVKALLTKNIDITETVLSAAAEEKALEKTLLDAYLLSTPDLEEEKIQSIAKHHGYNEYDLLQISESPDGWLTLAFQDDIMAEDGTEGNENISENEALTYLNNQITRPETEEVFSAKDIAALKMEVIASQDPQKRIEAIRKLIYAPSHDSDKPAIFINALTDRSAGKDIRREAVEALEKIGLEEKLCTPLQNLFAGDEKTAIDAVQRIANLVESLDEAQKSVVLAVLLKLLEQNPPTALAAKSMDIISSQAGVMSENKKKLIHFLRLSLSQLEHSFRKTHKTVSRAFSNFHDADPETVMPFLWNELEQSSAPDVKGFLIRQISVRCERPQEKLLELAGYALRGFQQASIKEDQRSYLKSCLITIGKPSIQAINAKLAETSGSKRSELVGLLDFVCKECDLTEETIITVVKTLLNLLKVAERSTRRRILETSVFAHPLIPDALRQEIATELLSHFSEFKLANTQDDICHSLQKLGPAAIPAILDYLKHNSREREADAVFTTLGRIAEEAGEELTPENARNAIGFCMGLFVRKDLKQGSFCIAMAWLCGYTPPGRGFVDKVISELEKRLWKSPFTFEIIEALGILAGSPNITTEHQVDIFDKFSYIITLKTDASLGVEKEGENGPVFEFGKGIDFETTVIPTVIKGFHRIGVGENTPWELRTKVVKRLLVLWEGVSHMRIVWSPSAVETLVNAIGDVASSPYIESDMRARLGGALLKCLNKTNVIRNLGIICSVHDKNDKMRSLSLDATELLLQEWENAYEEDMERRSAILRSLGAIAANNAFSRNDKEVNFMREKIVKSLFQGLRTGILHVQEPLQTLSECEGLSKKQRAEIKTRLEQAFGLVHVGS